ncbi:hypothetical protein GCM10008956_22330 [Deinococcus arenae]|uniref:DUF1345 domain-containing protein n=1 Tax=Deinococcus arenae TaxID=1452751 RepID=A0A8H9GRK8_9DEIO|nr:DUF1345 domain-containing protein [Deinococcus arenae]AWT35258.1 DUF1345 domain-containing protein [Deinococcus actinosclerus]GGM45605.1 hypothetical protein GCM10008956_22330 [Deinococcus arenae]
MTLTARRPRHAARRLLIGLVAGLLVGLATPDVWPPEARILLGWNVFTLSVMAQLWPLMMRAGPARTRELATREDDSRALAGTITMTAALVSLIGVVFLLSDAHDAKGTRELLLTALAVGTVATSWLLVQTEYTLHYARRYYRDGRGVLFPHGEGNLEEPTYWDFAYLSVTIGMTYQVSDTNLNTRAMRRLLLGHALLSFVFGTVIIAVTINGVAGLIQ